MALTYLMQVSMFSPTRYCFSNFSCSISIEMWQLVKAWTYILGYGCIVMRCSPPHCVEYSAYFSCFVFLSLEERLSCQWFMVWDSLTILSFYFWTSMRLHINFDTFSFSILVGIWFIASSLEFLSSMNQLSIFWFSTPGASRGSWYCQNSTCWISDDSINTRRHQVLRMDLNVQCEW